MPPPWPAPSLLRDYGRSVTAFHTLTASCNRCHQTFKVPRRRRHA